MSPARKRDDVRGGITALGIIFVFLGLSPWVPVVIGAWAAPQLGLGSVTSLTGITVFVCCLSPVLVAVGFLIFIAGLVAKSPAELAAMRPWIPPQAPPQVIYVQAPPPHSPPSQGPPFQGPPPPPPST